MQSPPAELGTDLLAVLLKNTIRSLGEADQDTISEQIRALVERYPHGRAILAGALVVLPAAFYRHIVGPLDR